MAAPSISTPAQPYVYQSPQASTTAFQILGTDAQILQVLLKPGERVRAEPGAMCYMSKDIACETESGGWTAGLWRFLAGESFFTNTYLNTGGTVGYIGLATPTLAKILPIDLNQFGGEFLCQKDAYLCSLHDVTIKAAVTRHLRTGLFGGEGFVLQKLVGRGLAFISAGGSLVQKSLGAGESIVIDAGCVVGMSSSVDFDVKYVGSVRRALFGGEGLFYAYLTGPGVVFIQSLPFSRLAGRVVGGVPSLLDSILRAQGFESIERWYSSYATPETPP